MKDVAALMGAIDYESVTADAGKSSLLAHKQLFAAIIGLCAVSWFMLLSGWLRVTPGSVMTKRQNVLFNSDTNLWMDRMIGNARSPERLVHPLEIPIWRPPCRTLHYLLETILPSEYAGVIAA